MTLDEYKEEISIIEYIKFRKDLDFIMQKEGKYIKAYVPNRDSEGKIIYNGNRPSKKEHIIIARIDINHKKRSTPGNENLPVVINEVYNNINDFDKTKPKSVIDFIHEYVLRQTGKINFGHVVGAMKQFMDHKDYVSLQNSSVDLIPSNTGSANKSNKKTKLKLSLPTEITFNYLKSRGIEPETYRSPLFIGTYGAINTEDTYNKERPAFPLLNEDGKIHTIQTIDFDGNKHNGKYFLKDIARNSAMYQSNFIPRESNTIVLIESPEKAMAHFQLYKSEMNTQKIRPLYNSSCGQFTANDLDVVRRQAAYKNIDNYILCFDNDKPGHVYTLNTLVTMNYVLPSVNVRSLESDVITVEFGKNTEDLLIKKGIKYQKENDVLVVKDKTQNLFKSLQPENIKVHPSITTDFLDDLQSKSKLPFQFKNNNRNLLI